MESKRLKQDDDGVRDGGEGNVTACLVAPLLEEQIPGTETCSYEGFEFTAALFFISGSDGTKVVVLFLMYADTYQPGLTFV